MVRANVYENQFAWVRWGSAKSEVFSVKNGTRQGSVLSPALFAIYMDEILVRLRNLGVGCYIGDVFMGAMGYADDLVLLAPSRTAMEMMLRSCEEFAKVNNLHFSTDPNPTKSKSKCVYLCGKKNLEKPLPLQLYGVELPWVRCATHLGNELCEDGRFDTDVRQKRAEFITKSLQIREQFSFAHPIEKLRAVSLYCCDHYGSMLWDLGSDGVRQYCNVWKTCVKLSWNLPRASHSYFLDDLSGGLVPVEDELLARYSGFFRSLLSSPCKEVAMLARIVGADIRSTTARNIRMIGEKTGSMTWKMSGRKIRSVLKNLKQKVTAIDAWRIPYLGKLLEERDTLYYQGMDKDSDQMNNLQGLIDSLCAS